MKAGGLKARARMQQKYRGFQRSWADVAQQLCLRLVQVGAAPGAILSVNGEKGHKYNSLNMAKQVAKILRSSPKPKLKPSPNPQR